MTDPAERQPIFTTPEAEGFTQAEIDDLIAEIESDDYDIPEDAIMIIRPRGRQSLTAPGVHSPLISTRVPETLLQQLKERAQTEGITMSELQRRIFSEYVGN